MEYTVTVQAVSEQVLAAARTRTTYGRVADEIGVLLGAPWRLVKGDRADLWTGGSNVAVYWGPPPDGQIEVGVQIAARFADTADVVCSTVPAGFAATSALRGVLGAGGRPHSCANVVRDPRTPHRVAVLGSVRRLAR